MLKEEEFIIIIQDISENKCMRIQQLLFKNARRFTTGNNFIKIRSKAIAVYENIIYTTDNYKVFHPSITIVYTADEFLKKYDNMQIKLRLLNEL